MPERWTGIKKLAEEMAELATVLAKLEAYPDGQHPDEVEHGPLIGRIEDEMGDVYAALDERSGGKIAEWCFPQDRELRLRLDEVFQAVRRK